MKQKMCRSGAIFILSIMILFLIQPSIANDREIKIALISDLNDAYGSTTYSPQVTKAMQFIASAAPQLVLCAGDMVAGQSSKIPAEKIPLMWDTFDSEILQRISVSGALFAFTMGNHDGAGQRFAHERQAAISFWQKNRPPLNYIDESGFPEYYSFELASIFFAVVDASSANIKTEQIEWLQNQLNGQPSSKARLRVVMGHLPLFAIAEGRNKAGDVINNADKFYEMLENGGADYYISGHHHAFYSSKKGKVKLISAGCLGGGPRRLVGSTQKPFKTLTLLSLFPEDKEFRLQTFDMTSEPKEVAIQELPSPINGFNGISQRYP